MWYFKGCVERISLTIGKNKKTDLIRPQVTLWFNNVVPFILIFFFTISLALFYMLTMLLKIRKTLKYTIRPSECGSENH